METITDCDMEEDDRITMLEPKFRSISLQALRPTARRQIAMHLDKELTAINVDNGMLCDWRGLAEMVGFSNLEISKMERSGKPTEELLYEWETNSNCDSTLGHLWSCLHKLDRKDVLSDSKSYVERDAQTFIDREERLKNDYFPLQEDTISSTTVPPHKGDHFCDETKLLTIHDIANPDNPVIYDAFVCYNPNAEGKDSYFVQQCIKQLEHKHGLQLCIPIRDCLAGGAKYMMDAELIKARCRRMVIVISHEFLLSQDCDFQVKFAQSLAPGARKKRLIPVLLEDKLKIPDILRHVTICDYTKPDLMEWFWDRLASSIRAPLDPEQELSFVPGNSHERKELSNSSSMEKLNRSSEQGKNNSRMQQSSSSPEFKKSTPEQIEKRTHSWTILSSRSSSESSSSRFSMLSAESLPDDMSVCELNNTQNSMGISGSLPKRKLEMSSSYESFNKILPNCQNVQQRPEQKSKAMKFFCRIQNALSKNK